MQKFHNTLQKFQDTHSGKRNPYPFSQVFGFLLSEQIFSGPELFVLTNTASQAIFREYQVLGVDKYYLFSRLL